VGVLDAAPNHQETCVLRPEQRKGLVEIEGAASAIEREKHPESHVDLLLKDGTRIPPDKFREP
jgi:hypothetical protein